MSPDQLGCCFQRLKGRMLKGWQLRNLRKPPVMLTEKWLCRTLFWHIVIASKYSLDWFSSSKCL